MRINIEKLTPEGIARQHLESLLTDDYRMTGSYLAGHGTSPERLKTIAEGRAPVCDVIGPLFLLDVFYPNGIGYYRKITD